MSPISSVRAFCLDVLCAGDLAAKLAAPRDAEGTALPDHGPGPAQTILAPARAPELRLEARAGRLPRPGALTDPAARAVCLARFAHHELMAVELFAFALLRWPDAPPALRRGWLHVLEEEQQHCRMYLDRLAAHGSHLGEHACSDYFWRHAPQIADSQAGPRAFLAAMGLTLEQANLDFAPLYADAFRAAGDDASADVCERVHADEIGHVRLAARWLRELDPGSVDDRERYERAVPFPLSAARAKGRRFDVKARRAAGLDPDFITYVERARSTQELAGSAEKPRDP